jgi:O-antigen ligase
MNAQRLELGPATLGVAPPAAESVRSNWLLYAFMLLLPLQNLQTGYMPNGGGLNFVNVGFVLSLLGAWRCRGTITRWSSVQTWVLAYVAYACVSLFIGYSHVSNTQEHFGDLKDSMFAVMLMFLVQMSVTNVDSLRRFIFVMLLPLPYMLRVTLDQHASVQSWHYDDALRIDGTFSLLGANEFSAFCVMMTILLVALVLATKWSMFWRVLLVAGIVCVALGVLWTYSRTGYVALMLGVSAVILLWHARWKMFVPLFLVALVLPNYLPPSVIERFDTTTIEAGKRDESTEMRFEFWAIAWDNFVKHPIFGSGYHTFHHPEINPLQRDTHNFFMRELTEKGAVGFFISIGMLLSILKACWRTFRDAAVGSLAYALGLGMIGAWVALIVGNCFGDRFTYYPMIGYFWVYLGLTLKAHELARGESAAEPADARQSRRFAQPRKVSHG